LTNARVSFHSILTRHLNNVSELATVSAQEAAEIYARKAEVSDILCISCTAAPDSPFQDLVPSEEISSTADLKALVLLSHILHRAGRMEGEAIALYLRFWE